ncbi:MULTISPECIES: hypothetical protein [unclassified Streptomyces]|uniref:hypothetical protein n=1 Tax=unclassified Streptomyces TaxID=2593676 RepID=UPI002553C602|nr:MULTISPECIES: hypothetical protein [unclassified Streptomyces]WRZ69537.1 hypothetical protein OG408_39030 [Streptomyces sp. NBC_01257]
MRAALRFLIDSADGRALDLAAALRGQWLGRGRLREGICLLDEVLALPAAGDGTARLRAREVHARAHRGVQLARTALAEAVRGFRELGESTWTHVPYQQLGRMLHEEGHAVQAIALLSEGLGLAQRNGGNWPYARDCCRRAPYPLGTSRSLTRSTRLLTDFLRTIPAVALCPVLLLTLGSTMRLVLVVS